MPSHDRPGLESKLIMWSGFRFPFIRFLQNGFVIAGVFAAQPEDLYSLDLRRGTCSLYHCLLCQNYTTPPGAQQIRPRTPSITASRLFVMVVPTRHYLCVFIFINTFIILAAQWTDLLFMMFATDIHRLNMSLAPRSMGNNSRHVYLTSFLNLRQNEMKIISALIVENAGWHLNFMPEIIKHAMLICIFVLKSYSSNSVGGDRLVTWILLQNSVKT